MPWPEEKRRRKDASVTRRHVGKHPLKHVGAAALECGATTGGLILGDDTNHQEWYGRS